MASQLPSETPPKPNVVAKRLFRLALAAALLAALACLIWGRTSVTAFAIRQARGQLATGAIGPAEAWLTWARQSVGSSAPLELAQADCYRQLGEREAWQQTIDIAKQQDAPPYRLREESKLADMRWGIKPQISEADYKALIEQGVSPEEALTTVVEGLIASGKVAEARQAILRWPRVEIAPAQLSYLNGLCHWSEDKPRDAQADFEQTFQLEPRHELACASLGRLFEQQEQMSEALPYYVHLAATAPNRDAVRLDLARVLRKLGRMDESRKIFPTPSGITVTRPIALEMAEREYASGNYAEALKWFAQADLDGPHIAETLRTAASAMALDDHFFDSQELFARVDSAQANSRHGSELRRRLEIDPNDPTAAIDLQQLTKSAAPAALRFQHRSQLYLAQCAACHGAHGQADGRAARFLFPRPRNLRQDRLRLISTLNTIPCRADIERVIRHGIPGTSMPAFPKLTQAELSELVDVVEDFRRQGMRERLTLVNQQAELELDALTIDELVAARTKPSDLLQLPAIGQATPAAIERGQRVYQAAGCERCHGPRGSPAVDLRLLDDSGRTVVPRDLAHDLMKGGADAAALYRRIRLGMPGSPHPGLADVTEEQLSDLVHYCQSLSLEPKLLRTNQERGMQAARRSDT